MNMKKNELWMLAAILICGIGGLTACGDDKDEEKSQDKMEALCHVLVSEDVLKVADITVHYLDAKGQEAIEQMNTTEWKKQWTTTTLPARIGVWAQLTPKFGLPKESYQLKVVASAGYLFLQPRVENGLMAGQAWPILMPTLEKWQLPMSRAGAAKTQQSVAKSMPKARES